MSEIQADRIPPTLEVRVLRDGVVVERQLCDSEAEANALIEAWSDVDGVVVEVDDLTRNAERTGVLEPRPWEVDAAEPGHESTFPDEEEQR